ncbi:MAG TPA: hypothetical protein VK864_08205 [Longimicrobiales bacterium]|nr:hypothetical protein [Longimicrobiales bacterium]
MKKLLAVMMLALLPLACDDDSSGPDDEDIAGTYTLRTVNGQNLPFALIVLGTAYRLEVTAASVTINANGTYSASSTLRETEDGMTTTTTETSAGTWTRTNNAITFRDTADQSEINASLGNDSVTWVEQGFTFVFRK